MRPGPLMVALASSFALLACAGGPGAGGGAAGTGTGGAANGGAGGGGLGRNDAAVDGGSAGAASTATGDAGDGLTGAGGSGIAGAGGGAACDVVWTLGGDVASGHQTATVADGAILLTTPLDSDYSVGLGHDVDYAETGDLDVSLDFEAFSPAGGDVHLLLGATLVNYGMAGAYNLPFAGMVSDGGVTYVTAGVEQEDGPSMGEHRTPTTSVKGTARIQRKGATFTMTATAASGETATFTIDLPSEQTEIDFFFGPAPGQTNGTGPASVRVTGFQLTDASGAHHDDTFDCMSARPI